jgi:endonuclease/exonuclease/phosphatase family metal-dependent hydrolase
VVLTGDFNSEPEEEAYQTLTGSGSMFLDPWALVPGEEHYGHRDTFSGFGYEGVPAKRIDHVLVGPRDAGEEDTDSTIAQRASTLPWKVQGYGVLANRFDDGVFLSDHRAVVVDADIL